MSQPIVPLTVPQSRCFEKKSRNDILMKIRLGKTEVTFFQSINMTIRLSDLGQVFLVCGKTDMRQGIDSLAYLVKSQFNLDPFSGQVYLFCGGRKDRFKALYWDGQGFWLLYKRFENGKLTWPNNEEEVKALTSEQVDWLMKGFAIIPKINVSKSRDFY